MSSSAGFGARMEHSPREIATQRNSQGILEITANRGLQSLSSPGTLTDAGERTEETVTTPTRLDAVGFVVDMLARVKDPAERIRGIRAVRHELARHDSRLDELLRDAILELRALDTPATWQEIGELLDVSAQRAHQLAAEHLTTTGRKQQ